MKGASKATKTPSEPTKPYGFVLILRGLARAAIRLDNYPASLRVLCVAAEYMNQDGVCKIGQDTIAARLNISRQAVNRHLTLLEHFDLLDGYRPKDGILKSYLLNMEGLEDEREGQKRVEKRRKSKRSAKNGSDGQEAPRRETPQAVAERQAGDCAKCHDEMQATESAKVDEYREGDSVFHQKFGYGRVGTVDGNKLTITFEKAGEKKVVDTFVVRFPKDATSDVAGGATS